MVWHLNITWSVGDTKFLFSCWKNISLVRSAHSWNIFQHSKRQFRISARPCNILYIWLLHVAATGQKVWPCTEILDHLPVFWLPLFLRFIKFSVQGQMGNVKNSRFFAFSLVSKCSYSRTALPIRTLRGP